MAATWTPSTPSTMTPDDNVVSGIATITPQLSTASKEELLEAIDRLRALNIDAEISIPQIVVCGDQSSGKSSVLEAIAGVRFPIGLHTVTCFATEIILRRSANDGVAVRLRPADHRTSVQRKHLETFGPDFEVSGPEDAGRVITAASEYLHAFEPERSIWDDVLQIKLFGPSKEHLTLVDIPGLVQATMGDSRRENKAKIHDLVTTYLKKPRTVVLAVVSATYDLQVQQIFDLIRNNTGVGPRTLGIITKPDCLQAGSDWEKEIIRLVQGETIHFGYGWHVLKNLPHEQTDRSQDRRDKAEREFFQQGSWSRIPAADRGIIKLRDKLKGRLFACITTELPALLADLESELRSCKQSLERLGPGRESIEAQRRYLANVLSKLQRLVETALEGDYEKAEFATFFEGEDRKRLRARIGLLTDNFAHNMNTRGSQYHIHNADSDRETFCRMRSSSDVVFTPPYRPSGEAKDKRCCVGLEAYCQQLAFHLDDMRGPYLPGLFPPRIIGTIFRQLSLPWEPLCRSFLDQCCGATSQFLAMAVNFAAGSHVGNRLMSKHVFPDLDGRFEALDDKAAELLWPYQRAQPMTFSSAYKRITCSGLSSENEDEGQSRKTRRDRLLEKGSVDSQVLVAAEALDKAEAYYRIALDTFVDNCAILAVEACLLNGLTALFDPELAYTLEDSKIVTIAAESEEAKQERRTASDKKAALESVIRTCRRHSHAAGMHTKVQSTFTEEAPSSSTAPSPGFRAKTSLLEGPVPQGQVASTQAAACMAARPHGSEEPLSPQSDFAIRSEPPFISDATSSPGEASLGPGVFGSITRTTLEPAARLFDSGPRATAGPNDGSSSAPSANARPDGVLSGASPSSTTGSGGGLDLPIRSANILFGGGPSASASSASTASGGSSFGGSGAKAPADSSVGFSLGSAPSASTAPGGSLFGGSGAKTTGANGSSSPFAGLGGNHFGSLSGKTTAGPNEIFSFSSAPRARNGSGGRSFGSSGKTKIERSSRGFGSPSGGGLSGSAPKATTDSRPQLSGVPAGDPATNQGSKSGCAALETPAFGKSSHGTNGDPFDGGTIHRLASTSGKPQALIAQMPSTEQLGKSTPASWSPAPAKEANGRGRKGNASTGDLGPTTLFIGQNGQLTRRTFVPAEVKTWEGDPETLVFQMLGAGEPYKEQSFEEIRLRDYGIIDQHLLKSSSR